MKFFLTYTPLGHSLCSLVQGDEGNQMDLLEACSLLKVKKGFPLALNRLASYWLSLTSCLPTNVLHGPVVLIYLDPITSNLSLNYLKKKHSKPGFL